MESGSSQVSDESSFDYTFAFNNAKFSDRILQLQIMPDSTVSRTNPTDSLADSPLTHNRKRRCPGQDSNAVQSNDNQSSTPEKWVKNIHITTAILAAKSPFFYKAKSNKKHVTLQIQEPEEAAFMDMLKFVYTNTLSKTMPSALLDVLIVADKYEVVSCMKGCLRLLSKSPITYETAMLYLGLPSTILMDNAVQPLVVVAKEMLVTCFKDISKFQKEMLNLPLAAIEVILSHDDVQVDSEDTIYDFVMKWAQCHYTSHREIQEIMNKRLLYLIRVQYMSCDKLKELMSCTYIDPKCSSELVFEALSFQMSLVSLEKERAYKLRPVKVITFDSPHEECVVYLNLKREECTRLIPNGLIYSRNFHFGGKVLYLLGKRAKDKQGFGLYLGMREKGSVVECEFSTRMKPSGDFAVIKKTPECNFSEAVAIGYLNLYDVTWDKFIAEDSLYFINGVLHLRATIRFKKEDSLAEQ